MVDLKKAVFQRHSDALVVSLGGSMLFKPGTAAVDSDFVRKIAAIFEKTCSSGKKLVVVVGGGARAKKFAEKARAETGSEFFADREAIKATRKNARVLQKVLGEKAFKKIVKSPDDAAAAIEGGGSEAAEGNGGKIVFCGGFLEGLTTDACAVLVAERLGALAVFNVSNVDGVYDSDPRENSSAKKFVEMTHTQLVELAARSDSRMAKGRMHFVFDLVACKLAGRSNITIHFVDGRNLQQVEKALAGALHDGTVVKN